MNVLCNFIRKFAGAIKDDYHIQDIKIFFSAPKPSEPSSKTLTIEKDKAEEANFQWLAYQVLFSVDKGKEDPNYYIYSEELNPGGSEKPPFKVFESDSNWSAKNKNMPTKDMTVGDVKRAFPEILKGPNLKPDKYGQVVYVNTDESEKGKSYSSKDFKKYFDNNFYVVLNPKSKEQKNPFGKLIGLKGTEKMNEELYNKAVKVAMEKESKPFSGGFDIMERLYEKQRKEQQKKKSLLTPIVEEAPEINK